jgi:hypothetical protein
MKDFKKIEPWIREFIAENDLVVLRNSRGKALSVSYTEDGLKWAANKFGKLLYFDNAHLRHRQMDDGSWVPYVKGELKKSPRVTVEKFVPRDHRHISNQIAEYFWVNRGMKMLYHVPDYIDKSERLVYTSNPGKSEKIEKSSKSSK